MSAHAYPGSELELFRHAINWKRYYSARLRPFIRGDVLEVGAGVGGSTEYLCAGGERSWTCLEPDLSLLEVGRARLDRAVHDVPLIWRAGVLQEVPAEGQFDSILYIDVLEHIADDRNEILEASRRLAPGGCLAILSPAHAWLYSAFDSAVGHCRRYTIDALRHLTPAETRLVYWTYLDSLGALLSLGNRLLLKSAHPTTAQIRLWDRWIVPASECTFDRALRTRLGRSVAAVWQRKGGIAPTGCSRRGTVRDDLGRNARCSFAPGVRTGALVR